MLSIIRPSTYQANLERLQPDFYRYRKIEDELAADLIGRNLLKLLKKAPAVYAKRRQRELEISDCDSQRNSECSNEDGRIFHSDSSISSNCSSISSTSSNSSIRSSFSSLTEAVKRKKRKDDLKAEVVLPEDMMSRVVRDLVRMGEGEQHGIRGCSLILELMDGDAILRLGRISCDPNIAATFTLRLQLTAGTPPLEAQGSHVLLNRLLGSPAQYLYIKPGYVIEKLKRTP